MRKFGLIGPDKRDRRDFILTYSPKLKLPRKADLRSMCPGVFDQGNLGSCVANACIGAMLFNDKNDGDDKYTVLSRLMLYYLCRQVDGSNVNDDTGTYARTAVKCLAKFGTCSDSILPYIEPRFAERPSHPCFDDAYRRRIFAYHRIISLFDMKACLAAGKPFVLGIPIFESFESDKATRFGDIPMPKRNESLRGYHAIYCCGYDDQRGQVTCANSWGVNWGDQGFFVLLYEYLEKYVVPEGKGDCWTITRQLIA